MSATKAIRVRVLRACWAHGRCHEVGEVFSLDAATAGVLVDGGKAELVDDAQEARQAIREASTAADAATMHALGRAPAPRAFFGFFGPRA